jgi:hypothetical protein
MYWIGHNRGERGGAHAIPPSSAMESRKPEVSTVLWSLLRQSDRQSFRPSSSVCGNRGARHPLPPLSALTSITPFPGQYRGRGRGTVLCSPLFLCSLFATNSKSRTRSFPWSDQAIVRHRSIPSSSFHRVGSTGKARAEQGQGTKHTQPGAAKRAGQRCSAR